MCRIRNNENLKDGCCGTEGREDPADVSPSVGRVLNEQTSKSRRRCATYRSDSGKAIISQSQ